MATHSAKLYECGEVCGACHCPVVGDQCACQCRFCGEPLEYPDDVENGYHDQCHYEAELDRAEEAWREAYERDQERRVEEHLERDL